MNYKLENTLIAIVKMLETDHKSLYCAGNIHSKCGFHQHKMLEYQAAKTTPW